MRDSKIKTNTNIWLSKEYLKRFYENNDKPNWVVFCEKLIDKGFEVFVYFPKKFTSIYITVVKNCKMQVVRFSDHITKQEKWLKTNINYYVGSSELGMFTEKEVLDAIDLYFR